MLLKAVLFTSTANPSTDPSPNDITLLHKASINQYCVDEGFID
jgi:hypothetical protein